MEPCRLISGPFALSIQFLLFLIVLSALYYKRTRERPQRPVRVWALDVAKQIVGGGEAHTINVLIAMILDKKTESLSAETDECEWYFTNFTIDTTLGVFLNVTLLRTFMSFAASRNWSLGTSGDYGNPVNYNVWAKQLGVWLLVIPLVKLLLLSVIVLLLKPLSYFGAFVLGWLQPTPNLELAVVMVVCPCAMNLVQYWIQDTFLKHKGGGDGYITDEENLL